MIWYLFLGAFCTFYNILYLIHNIKKSNALAIVGSVIGIIIIASMTVIFYITSIG